MTGDGVGRRIWAGLQLLDRQLVAREGKLAGCIDDLELRASDDGNELFVTAIISGPGGLAYRLGHRRFGSWLRRAHARVLNRPDGEDPARIPFDLVNEIGSHVGVSLDFEEVGVASADRWVRDHIVAHIPGSGHEPE